MSYRLNIYLNNSLTRIAGVWSRTQPLKLTTRPRVSKDLRLDLRDILRTLELVIQENHNERRK
jgi:hypothetical protein